MDKKPLIGVSILAVVLLVLGSLSNVVGYQQVQSSNQSVIKERVNQRELLFQTIIDIANNKEIQRIILKSQISKGEFFHPGVRFSVFDTFMLTKSQLKQIYFIGLILSKTISKSRIHSIIEKYQLNNQEIQKEITAIIEKNTTINEEITQLSNSECDCDNNNTTSFWHFPTICLLLFFICIVAFNIYMLSNGDIFWQIFWGVNTLGGKLSCFWYIYLP